MKGLRLGSGWPVRAVWVLLAALVLHGCATGPKIDWNTRIGNYTYDQAVLELGPPDKVATITGGTRVAEWLTWRGHGGYVTTFGPEFYGPFYYGPSTYFYSEPPSPDRFLRLTFGPDGRLITWQKVYR